MKKIFFIALLASTMSLFSGYAQAVTGSDWKAGRIIDDAIFTDKNALSVAQIQQFLDSKMSACDTHGTGSTTYEYPASSGNFVTTSRALYSYRRGNGAVTVVKPNNIPDSENSWYTQNTWFRCLNDYWENPDTGANNYANRPTPAGAKSAANLIWDAAQAHNISPKVLLVTLQKEQTLITDTWPFQNQYLYAMGAYCPDGAGGAECNPAYAGFGKQMKEAASLFRYYLDNMSQPWWSNKKPGNNNVLWQVLYKNGVATNCGGSNIYIENTATAALYTYTPYQPNQAALNNLYGEGDACSAYGNRNFWRMFHDWFGTTYADAYVAQFNAQSAHPSGYAGQEKEVYIRFKNLGSSRWYDSTVAPEGINPVRLAATNPINRKSVFSYSWYTPGRPLKGFSKVLKSNGTSLSSNQSIVEPGEIAEFKFSITIPYNIKTGTYREYFQPVLEGASNWVLLGNNMAWLDVKVLPSYSAEHVRQSPYPVMTQNGYVDYFIDYKNTGYAPWYDSEHVPTNAKPIHLATSGPTNRKSIFGDTWENKARPATKISKVFESDGKTLATDQTKVTTGQIARFSFILSASESVDTGFYREYFQPIVEGSPDWNIGGISWIDVSIVSGNTKASYHSQSDPTPTIDQGQATTTYLSYKNTGNTTWYDTTATVKGILPIRLAATNPINRESIFSFGWSNRGRPSKSFTKVYEGDGKTLSTNQKIVNPGQIAKFEFPLTAPWTLPNGQYREFLQPVLEGSSEWNIGGYSWFDITVK